MGSLNTTTFQYNGARYSFTAIISWDQTDQSKSRALDNSHINSFMYENEMNTLFLRGYIEYTDTRGEVDIILDKQFAYCEINFIQIDVKSDQDYTIDTPSKTHQLYQKFYIDSIQILDRRENEIKYRFNLVSRNWFQCVSKIDYSNYSTEKEDIVDIIKNLLSYSNLAPNKDTFDLVKSGVKINYITDMNDNAATAIGYLLNKMYYFHDKIPQFQFIIYNEHTDKYEMFDILNPNTWFNTYELAVTFFKNQIEYMMQSEGANFAATVKFPKTSLHTMINSAKYYDFDLAKNYITDEFIGNKTIQNFYNTYYDTGQINPNIVGLYKQTNAEYNYNRYSTYWNNLNKNLDINLYNEMFSNFTQGNSLVVNTGGNILRKPGCILNISIDRDVKNDTGSDEGDDTQAFLDKYKAYEGRWFITKVQHFLDLRQYKYTQNCVCCRNFMMKSGAMQNS